MDEVDNLVSPPNEEHRYDVIEYTSRTAVSVTSSNGTGEEGGQNCLSPCPFFVHQTAVSIPIYGFVTPPVILVTVITNSLICAVLLRRNMRTATNALLLAMAIADMMTGVWPLPCYVYFYTLGAYRYHVSFSWCLVYYALTEHLPTMFHTASIWLTVALALHRYISVCRPQLAKTWCTVSNVVKLIVGIYAASCLSHVIRLFECSFEPVEVRSLVNDEADNETDATDTMMIGCRRSHAAFVMANDFVYFGIYYWFRVVFIHLVPCSVLVVFNALLLVTMRQAHRRRRQLLAQNRKTESRRIAESNHTTTMLVAVVGVFLLLEFPLALLIIVLIVDRMSWFNVSLLDQRAIEIAPLLMNTLILLSYPINFFIYCAMSQQFRETFTGMFTPIAAAFCSSKTTSTTATTTLSVNQGTPSSTARVTATNRVIAGESAKTVDALLMQVRRKCDGDEDVEEVLMRY